MGKRCGCAGNCSCQFKEGRGVRLSGAGSKLDPVKIEIRDGQAFIQGSATPTVEVLVTGTGTTADPYRVTMTRYDGDAGPPLYMFTTPGSYVFEKPTFGTIAMVYMAGGGGGGGAGSAYTGDNNQRYGVGGWGGQTLLVEYLLDDLEDEIPITVGAGGGGGAIGSSGGAGGSSSFNGGTALGGAGGASTPQTPGPGQTDPRLPAVAGQGGAGGLYTVVYFGIYFGIPPGNPGGAGYPGQPPSGGAGGPYGGSSPGGNGDPGPMVTRYRGTGGGGGGGSGSSGRPGGVGGPGAGGGGGGAGNGPGGVGGAGYVIVLIQ